MKRETKEILQWFGFLFVLAMFALFAAPFLEEEKVTSSSQQQEKEAHVYCFGDTYYHLKEFTWNKEKQWLMGTLEGGTMVLIPKYGCIIEYEEEKENE